MSDRTIRIDRRFRGPPESGNGGYVCGRLARFVDGPAAVRLRAPPPLDTELEVRDPGDGLRIFPGPVPGRSLVAAPWVPDPALATGGAGVDPEYVWAALDCPGGFSFAAPDEGAVVLGELRAEIRDEVSPGEPCVIAAWELRREGRKHRTATALFGPSGTCRAVGVGTWFEVEGFGGE